MKKMLLFLIVTFARKKIKSGDAVSGRNFILGNEDLLIGVVTPTEKMDYFYRNGDGDEMLFVHYGTGKLKQCSERFTIEKVIM